MRYTDYVNPLIGTAGSGHAIPGPQRPHGMVKFSPDTIDLPCAGYDYNGGKIIGFSHTHLEGVGGDGGRGHLLLSASTGPLRTDERAYASRFSHEEETARPGYYQVRLLDYGINAELTAAEHCGLIRFTFPAGSAGRVLVDVGHTIGTHYLCRESAIRMLDETRFEGWGLYPLEPNDPDGPERIRMFFVGQLSRPIAQAGVWSAGETFPGRREISGSRIGLWLEADGQILIKTAISYISCDKAWSHLRQEIPAFDFEELAAETAAVWEGLLSRVRVSSPCEDDLIQFYSALYRSLNQPTDYTEGDRYFDGVGERTVFDAEGSHFYSDDWALWDTFRTTHPLQNLIEPERADDQARTLLRIYEHGGWLPMCTAPSSGYNLTMIGHSAPAVLADTAAAGFTDFDRELALEAMQKQALSAPADPAQRKLGTHQLYLEKGYLPADAPLGKPFSVSETLECVYGDWCTAQMALALGKEDEAAPFLRRAGNYRRLFDPQTGFMRPRRADGSFVTPFDPTDAFKNGFCETTSWETTFFVPHDVQGLINLIGSDEAFARRLDTFFEKGYYNNQNEPGIQTLFLYNYAHRPWKTQETTLRYVRDFHHNRPGGLYPEDDAGAMSAWYVFASLGFYPVCPGQGVFVLTSPNVAEAALQVRGGAFRLRCVNFSRENRYIQSARLNGALLDRCWLRYEEVYGGGELELTMGSSPNFGWASAPGCEPPSMTRDRVALQVLRAETECRETAAGEPFTVTVQVENRGAEGGDLIRVMDGAACAGELPVFLAPGERKTVEIPCAVYALGEHGLSAGGVSAGTVAVIGEPFLRFSCPQPPKLSAIVLPEGQAVTVSASGFQGRDEYGILYDKLPFTGDFEATVRVDYEENTNPYARAGLLACPRTDLSTFLAVGAMSVRGFFFQWTPLPGEDPDRQQYAIGCPKVPYWFRLTRRNGRFIGCCSSDGQNWTVLDEVEYPGESFYVGLFAQSGSELPRLVQFTDFRCKPL